MDISVEFYHQANFERSSFTGSKNTNSILQSPEIPPAHAQVTRSMTVLILSVQSYKVGGLLDK